MFSKKLKQSSRTLTTLVFPLNKDHIKKTRRLASPALGRRQRCSCPYTVFLKFSYSKKCPPNHLLGAFFTFYQLLQKEYPCFNFVKRREGIQTNIPANKGPSKQVKTAVSVIVTEPTTPSRSSRFIDCATPIIWDEHPTPIPFPIKFVTPLHFNRSGPIIIPVIPAIITNAAVKDGIPPICSDTLIATGIVTDLGNAVRIRLLSVPNIRAMTASLLIATTVPTITPPLIGTTYFFKTRRCLYNGIAKATIPGPRSFVIQSPPFFIYAS